MPCCRRGGTASSTARPKRLISAVSRAATATGAPWTYARIPGRGRRQGAVDAGSGDPSSTHPHGEDTPREGKEEAMARPVFGMNQSLDGYVDHMAFAPDATLFRHFIAEAEGQAGSLYGRQLYEIMRYWDDDHPEWGADERAFAAA